MAPAGILRRKGRTAPNVYEKTGDGIDKGGVISYDDDIMAGKEGGTSDAIQTISRSLRGNSGFMDRDREHGAGG